MSICSQLGCGGAVGKHQAMILSSPPGGNRRIGVAQSYKRSSLVAAGHQPEDAPGTIDNWVSQGHPPSALIDSGQGDGHVVDVQDGISRYQRSGVTVRPEAEMHEVQ